MAFLTAILSSSSVFRKISHGLCGVRVGRRGGQRRGGGGKEVGREVGREEGGGGEEGGRRKGGRKGGVHDEIKKPGEALPSQVFQVVTGL